MPASAREEPATATATMPPPPPSLGYAAPRVLLAAALQAGCMYVSSRTLQLSGTALLWPCTPVAALVLALHPPWLRRWLAAAQLLTYAAMVLFDCGKVRGSFLLNALFLVTDAAEVASVALCLGALLPDTPSAAIRTGAALNAIMLYPLLLAPLKEGANCLLVFLCFGVLRPPLWETLLIWLVGDCFMDFFACYATMVFRHYWWAGRRREKGKGHGAGGHEEEAADQAVGGAAADGPVDDAEAGRAAVAAAPASTATASAAAARSGGGGAWARFCRGLRAARPSALHVGDAVLFVLLLAVATLASVAAIVSNSPTVNRLLLYLSSRLLFPTVGYATVRYGQLGGCVHVGVVALSMIVADFVVDGEGRDYGLASVSAAGALLEVLVGPLRVVIMAWSISYLAVALAERQDTLSLLKQTNRELMVQGQELRAAKRAAEAALSSKSEFFARVSHEFRTPLNVVLGFSEELLQKREDPELALAPETADRLHYILAAGESLLRVVDDVLELFRLSSAAGRGGLAVRLAGVEVGPFFHTLCDLVALIAQEHGLHFIRTLDPDLPRFLYLDRVRFSQLVMNLASNACKYSRASGGVVSVRLLHDGPTDPPQPCHLTLRLEVQDNGPGIPSELKERIFESFFRARDPTAPADDAPGGMAAAGGAAGARAGGSHRAVSPPLPRPSPSRSPPPPRFAGGAAAAAAAATGGAPMGGHRGHQGGGRGKKGHGLGLAITKQLVDVLGGRIAVESSVGVGSLFSVWLPVREASGCTLEGEEEGGEENGEWEGAASVLDNAVAQASARSGSGSAVAVAVEAAAGGPSPAAAAVAAAAASAAAVVRELRVLVVEDIEVNQIVLGGMLRQDRHAATFVETGGAALAALDAAATAAAPFDVVLLDLQLPDMHGIDVLRALRAHADARLAALPVLVVSALALDREKQECARAGADGFVSKPIRLPVLREELRRLRASGRLCPPPGAGGAEDAGRRGGGSSSSSSSGPP